jgi:cobalamin biosynthesis protein CobT
MNKHPYEQIYASILRDPIHGIAATRAKLMQVLRSLDYVGWSKQEESGRLDRRALTRYATGQANIFSRREVVEADTAAVSVLVDCSASMRGKEIQCAQAIAIQLSSILSKSNASFEVNGFHGGDYGNGIKGYGGGGSSACTELVEFIPFKRWNEPLHRAAANLGLMDKLASNGTPDYSAIYLKLEELSRRTESRKILFLLTDAECYNTRHISYLQEFADKRGIRIAAIGIGQTEVGKCFRNAENVMQVSDIATKSFGNLLKAIA